MHRLMIVDDDAIIRKGLSRNIAWKEHGFQLDGVAGDGEEALKLFTATKPEIVISDIKMPFMDGLELARQILSKDYTTKIILLTGYEEFKYAKQALELKVFDYILKPVDLEKLLNTSLRAVEVLENERKTQWQIRESLPLLQQSFLVRLIKGKYQSEVEILNEAAFLEIFFTKNRFAVLVVKIDEYYNSKFFAEVAKQEAAEFQLASLCRENLSPDEVKILNFEGDELILIVNSDLKPGETTQYTLELGEKIQHLANERFKINITVGIGTVRNSLLEISGSYREAKAATEFRHIIGKNQVLTIGDTGMPISDESVYFPEIDEELAFKVKLGLSGEALAIIDEIENKLLSLNFVSLSSARLIGMQQAIFAIREAEIWNKEDGVTKSNLFFEQCRRIQEGETVAEIFAGVRRLVTEITEEINRKRETMQLGLVDQAIQYIERNYSKEGLSLSEVAQAVHISPVYLSIIFKKEHNINFSEFLTGLRMKKAMELLRNSDYMTYEVAEKVGYVNSQYFSVCFKKYFGSSPSDFKKQT